MSAALWGRRAFVSPHPHLRISLSVLPLTRQSISRHAFSTDSSKNEPSPSSPKSSSLTLPSNNSTTVIALEYGVNAPRTTRPPELNLPERIPSSSKLSAKFKRFIGIGRAYASFYKTGLKNVYHNYRASLPIRRALGLSPYIPVSPPPTLSTAAKTIAFRKAIHTFNLSRSHFQLVRRSAGDARRMIPFTLLLLICDELTPILLPIIGNAIIPLACWTPGQIEKERSIKTTRKHGAMTAHKADHPDAQTSFSAGSEQELELLAKQYANAEWAEKIASSEGVLRACAVFNLVKAHDRFGRLPLVPQVYRPRLRRYVEYLNVDDSLIRTSGGVQAMDALEVRLSVEERGGIDVSEGKVGEEAEKEERLWLERWLESRRES
ncbi:hypothetical protein ASPWEDRAFT_37899 [Aspergillus wentii DTO 134E9]|uniref:Uncharacterized protein n=1 Tax=Aspergillus wentii DTO 134E9 TaxID=1073089 RepID=A0A1L9RNC1_ASPWE|nr:uncharacterized protein ASPWEDRAFT_37899 [Aspergillus wentii DTO 134E9]KAI9925992.1 hypothetical protein MW887_004451 [Aspergillus wentii]OJJ36328.1 hypothetical protein ASPWEDRAFT_37899 [Aspergillus wentii DTO 134E9]